MNRLRFVANAIRHAEAFADEAEDIGRLSFAARLNRLAQTLTHALDAALAQEDAIEPRRLARNHAHQALTALWNETTLQLRGLLGAERAAALDPGAYLDVVDRTRFLLKKLHEANVQSTLPLQKRLQRGLDRYDAAVVDYLEGCAQLSAAQEAAIAESQIARVKLEQAKAHLLSQVPVGSDAAKRIRARAVRTKRARWIDEMVTQKGPLMLTVTQESLHSEMSLNRQ